MLACHRTLRAVVAAVAMVALPCTAIAEKAQECPEYISCNADYPCYGTLESGVEICICGNVGILGATWWTGNYCSYSVTWGDGSQSTVNLFWY